MPRFKDQAVCIRIIDWSETSQVVALMTQKHGKLRGLAKGSKRASPSSVDRFSGGIELLTLGQAVGMVKATADLASITEWDLQQSYTHLRRDLDAHQLGLYAADLVGAMLADRDPHPATFEALSTFLGTIALAPARNAALLQFQWRLLDDCGYRPQIEHDAVRGKALQPQVAYTFDARAGGITSDSSPPDNLAGRWRVRHETVQLLRTLNQDNAPEAEPDSIGRANRLLCVYTRSILDTELPTMRFVLDPRA